MLNNMDLYIAAALFLVMAIVFIGTRVGVMPKKSIPVVAGAVFGALGLGIFAAWRRRAADAQIEDLKNRIAKRDQELAELMRQRKFANEEVAAAQASLNNQLAAVSIQRQGIADNLEKEKTRIAALPATEVHDELTRLLQEEAAFQRRSGGVKPQE